MLFDDVEDAVDAVAPVPAANDANAANPIPAFTAFCFDPPSWFVLDPCCLSLFESASVLPGFQFRNAVQILQGFPSGPRTIPGGRAVAGLVVEGMVEVDEDEDEDEVGAVEPAAIYATEDVDYYKLCGEFRERSPAQRFGCRMTKTEPDQYLWEALAFFTGKAVLAVNVKRPPLPLSLSYFQPPNSYIDNWNVF